MKQKRYTKLAALAAMVLLCCGAIFTSTSVRAQCPTCDCPPVPKDDAQSDSTKIKWNGADTCVDLIGDGCLEKICYIYRCTDPPDSTNFDYAVTQVCWGADGCSEDDSTLIDSAGNWLMEHNPQNFPTGTCPPNGGCGNQIQWNESWITCWTYCFTSTGGKMVTYCPDHGWCIDAYWVCKDPVTGLRKLCYDRSVQTTWQCNTPPPGQCENPCWDPWGGCPSWQLH